MHIATRTLIAEQSHAHSNGDIAEQSHAHSNEDIAEQSHLHSNGDIAEQSHVHSKGVNCSELFDLEGLHQSLTGLVTDDDHGQNIVHIIKCYYNATWHLRARSSVGQPCHGRHRAEVLVHFPHPSTF